MILQALYEYYQRKAADPESCIAPEGFEWKGIPFIIVIDKDGNFVRLEDTREGDGRARSPQEFLVPRGTNRAGPGAWKNAFLLWDHFGYVLGYSRTDDQKDIDLAQRQHGAFIKRLQDLPKDLKKSAAIAPILTFYEKNQEERVLLEEQFDECKKISGCNFLFRIEGQPGVITDDTEVKRYSASLAVASPNTEREEEAESGEISGVCLVTGSYGPIARTHARTPINKDTKSLVAVQRSSGYDSFGKQQAYNCPVGKAAEFAYTTALNVLLGSDHNQLRVGDSTFIYWAQKKDSVFEKNFKPFFFASSRSKDDPDKGAADAKSALLSVLSGIPPEEAGARFCILGLAPNSARISVRVWHEGPIKDFCANMRQHFDDLDILAPSFDECRMSLQYLLGSTVLDWKSENIPPNLAGNVMRSVLENIPYPATFANQCLGRVRAERNVTRVHASILKACLNRRLRISNPDDEKEMTVALDQSNMNVGYRLGRLFAVLEKIQEDANPGINATIRDRFYGAASSNPVAVFPQLMKLKNHHLSKMENQGFKVAHEKRLAEIFDGFGNDMPAHLDMDDQSRFAIGYYHQRQALFMSNRETK